MRSLSLRFPVCRKGTTRVLLGDVVRGNEVMCVKCSAQAWHVETTSSRSSREGNREQEAAGFIVVVVIIIILTEGSLYDLDPNLYLQL